MRAETLNPFRVAKRDRDVLRAEFPDDGARRLPLVRGDCVDGARPCPLVSCRYHLYLDVTEAGSIKFNFPDVEPEALEYSCALDLADRGGLPLEDVGAVSNLTRERVRQVELIALTKLETALGVPAREILPD